MSFTPDFSAIPPMPDGRTAAEHIAEVASSSRAVRVPMGNGGRQMWHIWGEGSGKPNLLLFHGGSGSWIHWIRNVLPLSKHFTVFAADHPGLGDSDPPDDVRDIWSVAHCVKAGIERVVPAGEPFDIVGFSFGGMVGGHVSTLLDERLRSVTLVGPGGLRLKREPRDAMVALRRVPDAEALAAGARRNLEILMVHDPATIDPVALHMQILNSTRAKTRSAKMSAAGVLSDVLPRITHRLNAIWGEFDSTAYPYMQAREDLLRSFQPDIDFRIIPGGGHWVAFEKAEEFNATLVDMLQPAKR